MPYKTNRSLPKAVRNNLPQGAQTIFRKVYNNAEKQYKDPKKRRGKSTLTEVCSKVAWFAVKNEYKKQKDKWVKK
jgi:cation transport regulator